MKRALTQATMSLPLVRSVLMKRNMFRMRLRSLRRKVYEHATKRRLDRLRRDVASFLRLPPLFVAPDRQAFDAGLVRADMAGLSRSWVAILQEHRDERFLLRRFCLCCNETTRMLVDYRHASVDEDGIRTPNWRERVACRRCLMNNRQRLMAKLVQQSATERTGVSAIYLMEQVTPIFEWVRALPRVEVRGSEYLGPEHAGGTVVDGLRHEDVLALSFADASFDLVVSNDVLEHVPDPLKALQECFRVLRPGGEVLATIPFDPQTDRTVVRARMNGGAVEHLLPPQYHGNPVSMEGSLVFQDFGWDLLDRAREIGFSSAACEVYGADAFGHLGPSLLVFRLAKPAA